MWIPLPIRPRSFPSPRHLPVGPLADRAQGPGDAMRCPAGGESSSGSTAPSGSPPSSTPPCGRRSTWRRSRRSQERKKSRELRIAAGLADARQVASRVVTCSRSSTAKRSAWFRSRKRSNTAPRTVPRLAPLPCAAAASVEVVPCGQRAQLLQQLGDRVGRLVQQLAGRAAVERDREPPEPLHGLAAGEIELAIAAGLGGVEGTPPTVFDPARWRPRSADWTKIALRVPTYRRRSALGRLQLRPSRN